MSLSRKGKRATVFSAEPPPPPISRGWRLQRKRRKPAEAVPPIQCRAAGKGEHEAEFSETEQELTRRLCISVCYILAFQLHVCYIALTICFVHVLSEVMIFYPSNVVNQLNGMGIRPIATELAWRGLPLAGRLKYFMSNWGKSYPGPVGARSDIGVQSAFHAPADSASCPKSTASLLRRGRDDAGRDPKHGREACNRSNLTQRAGFLIHDISRAQKRRGSEACNKLEGTNLFTQSTSRWRAYTS